MQVQWPVVKLEQLLTLKRFPEKIDQYKIYKQITVRLHHKGVVLRDKKTGQEIKSKQYHVKEGQFIISKIDARNGAMGLVPEELDGAVVTSDFLSYDIDESKLFAKYLDYLTSTRSFVNECIKASKGTTNRVRLEPARFLQIKIPLPPIEKQKEVVSKIERLVLRIEEARRLRTNTVESEHNAHSLELKNQESDILMRAIRAKIFNVSNPLGPLVSIGKSDLLMNKETVNPKTKSPNEDFLYLDISGVEGGTGRILQIKKYKGHEAPSRARRVMKTGDVLVSTVRPYLKSFTIVPQNLNNQICSTGFAVFTCPPNVDPSFLLHQFFSDFFIEQCLEKMRGAHYPAINSTKLRECELMFPPIETQRRIIAYLDSLQEKLHELEKLQAETRKEMDGLIPSILDRTLEL